MRILFASIVLTLATPAAGVEPQDEAVRKHFRSDNYAVRWGTAPAYDAGTEVEVGDGNGHGGTLRWLRFQADKDGVSVLSMALHAGGIPFWSKWPPDRATVAVNRARMKPDGYAALLRSLAVVGAATTDPIKRDGFSQTFENFWVYSRATSEDETLLDLNWSGYEGSRGEANYARPRVAVRLARDAIKELDFAEHALTKDERAWASAKFARDWKRFTEAEKAEGMRSHWWVRERYIMAIGVTGDASALPTLRDILRGDPKDRCVYHAINAITRLTKVDVRGLPVEEMDVEETRRKLLDLLPDGK